MSSYKWFWVIIGLYAINIIALIVIIISFSFGVPDNPYDEVTRLNIKLQYGEVRCNDLDRYYGVKYTLGSGETFQCGYQISTVMLTYVFVILLGVLDVVSLIFATQDSQKLTIISMIITILVPFGLLLSLILQSIDITRGLEICDDMLNSLYNAECNAGGFIVTAIITVVGMILAILLPIALIYVRCCHRD